MYLPLCWCFALTAALAAAPAFAAPPAVTDERLVLEQVAREPDVVTPTGLSVDEQGCIWVIENHTHQRGPGYTGPGSDQSPSCPTSTPPASPARRSPSPTASRTP